MSGRALVASLLSGVVAAGLARALLPPTPRLAARVRPYTIASRSELTRDTHLLALPESGALLSPATLRRVLGPFVAHTAARFGRFVDGAGDEALRRKLDQAGLFRHLPEPQRVPEYRVRQLAHAVGFTLAFAAVAVLARRSTPVVLAAGALGLTFGATRLRSRLDNAIEERTLRIQLELYTVNQLLAMHVRVGGGVVQAIQRVVERGNGVVVTEFADVLAAHRSGRRLSEALEHAAHRTPSAHAARTYKLLAGAVEHGADLAEGLRALSADIRAERSEALKRAATRRRAAMLVPIIAILAPVMLLFIAAPLPAIVFGGHPATTSAPP